MNLELIIRLFKYYAQFVPKKALEKIFVVSEDSQPAGYAEAMAEMLNAPDNNVFPDISSYIFSMNEKFVSDKIKNNSDIILFVEYGAISFNPKVAMGTSQKLAVYVAFPLTMANNDNMKEALIMEQTLDILTSIIGKMETDQSTLDFCGNSKLIDFPAEIYPIESYDFYDHSGWMAIFDYEQTDLL